MHRRSRPTLILTMALASLTIGRFAPAQPARAPSSGDAALASMADAERAFARAAAVKGIRAAFLEWFAEEAVGFQPSLGRAQDQLRAQPVPAEPLAATLEWEPRAGDISRSGDFGWLTGPYTFRPPAGEPSHGVYFSVWIKTAAGWRVFMDVGAAAPGPVSFAPGLSRMPASEGRFAARSPETPEAKQAAGAAAVDALQAADDRANAGTSGSSANGGLSIVAAMDPQARLHRPGMPPIVGREAIRAHLTERPWHTRFTRAGTRLAPGLDFGVTHGAFQPRPGATVSAGPIEAGPAVAPPGASGYYIRVWRRAADGRWLIVADLTQPAPPAR
jgi:ketosteroid isomerase-like protein